MEGNVHPCPFEGGGLFFGKPLTNPLQCGRMVSLVDASSLNRAEFAIPYPDADTGACGRRGSAEALHLTVRCFFCGTSASPTGDGRGLTLLRRSTASARRLSQGACGTWRAKQEPREQLWRVKRSETVKPPRPPSRVGRSASALFTARGAFAPSLFWRSANSTHRGGTTTPPYE